MDHFQYKNSEALAKTFRLRALQKNGAYIYSRATLKHETDRGCFCGLPDHPGTL